MFLFLGTGVACLIYYFFLQELGAVAAWGSTYIAPVVALLIGPSTEERNIVTEPDLRTLYLNYIDCLNKREWVSLGQFVAADVSHNGRPIGLSGYREMLQKDVREIPDLRFNIELLAIEAPLVASRLRFDCSPTSTFMGLNIGGKRITFAENVFYAFRNGKIASVWSVIDKSAIEGQL